jgi:hypothetical protein
MSTVAILPPPGASAPRNGLSPLYGSLPCTASIVRDRLNIKQKLAAGGPPMPIARTQFCFSLIAAGALVGI